MTEATKTLVFIAAGAIALGGAYVLDRPVEANNVQQLVGETLTPEIDIDAPRRLEIVKFDVEQARLRTFEVAEIDGVWTIPTKDGYPADATKQMAAAVTSLIDREILRVVSDAANTHEQYGVVDPRAPRLNSKSKGVGTRVVLKDADDESLVDLVIGQPVKDQPGQRYVRRANQDVVYVIELDPTQLSTDFNDWIDHDLMQLEVMDLAELFINDYTAELSIGQTADGRIVPQVGVEPRGEITLKPVEDGAKWELASLKKGAVEGQQMTAVEDSLAADEEVNQDAVRELVEALDDLQIVDVAPKPEGLSADLKAGEAFLTERDAITDLVEKGFIPGGLRTGEDMLSSEGALMCTLNNGVKYVLRFGQLVQGESEGDIENPFEDGGAAAEPAADAAAGDAAEGQTAESDPAKAATDESGDEAKTAAAEGADAPADSEADKAEDAEQDRDLRRYLFVMVQFDEDAVEKPQYEEVPPVPEATGDEAASETEDSASAEGEEAAAADDADEPSADDQATEGEAADGDAAEEGADSGEADAETAREAAERRKEIEARNARLREEYETRMSEGRDEVARLNERFGDWYYVISNDVFKKIHLGRDQIVKKKEAEKPAEEGAAGAVDDAAAGLPDMGAAPGPAPAADQPAGE